MEIIFWLIPLSIVILAVAVKIFFWAVKDGQFNDLESPAMSILLDDDSHNPPQSNKIATSDNLIDTPDKSA
jgi:cbb3-type cytochrome oxidase maturation protein